MKTFEEAATDFIVSCDWINDSLAPAVASLYHTAVQLDKRYSSTANAEYLKAHRVILAAKPKDPEKEVTDRLDDLLYSIEVR